MEVALDFRDIRDVIEMAVRQEQKLEIDIPGDEPIASPIGRVEKNPALQRFNKITIRFENAATKGLVSHYISL
jgi:hypothetical protein